MEVESAMALINDLTYFPGWEFEVSDHCKRFEGSVTVKVTYPSFETNRKEASEGFPVENHPYATFPLMVHGMTAEDLYYAMGHILMSIYEHEMREALRVKPTFWAPFHPHRIDGIKRWTKARKHAKKWRMQMPDLQFGIA